MDVFGALADQTRRALLVELSGEPRRVVDLAARHAISRPAVSRHLRLLLQAGVVSVEERGRERYYTLERAALAPVAAYVSGLTGPAAARPVPEHALDALETEVRRTTREREKRSSRDQHPDRSDRTA